MIKSLALRVLTVCLVLIVIPLLIHTLYMSRRDYHAQLGDLFLTLNALSREKAMLAGQMVRAVQNELNTIEILTDPRGQVQGSLNQKFKNIAEQDGFSSIFYLKSLGNGEFLCTQASSDKMIGQKNTLTQVAERAFVSENQFFNTKKDQNGILAIGISIQQWIYAIAPLKNPPYLYRFSLITPQGNIYSTGNADIPIDQVLLYGEADQLPLFQKEVRLLKDKRVGFKLPIVGTDLYIAVDAAATVKSNAWSSLSFLLLFILIVGGLGALLLIWRISKPLKSLNRVMDDVERGNLSARYREDKMGFEINILGAHFNRMIGGMLQHMRVSQELQIGHEIQRSLLPSEIPAISGLEIATGFLPAKEVAGDFYDLFEKGGKWFIVIADAVGKGIPACLYSLSLRSLLRALGSTSDDLAQIIQKANALFYKDVKESSAFVTAWIGLYDPQTKTLEFSNCGHHPILLKKSSGTILELTTEGTALGAIETPQISTASKQLEKGDLLVLYTDGVTEAHDEKNNLYGKDRLLKALETKDSPQALLNDITTFSHSAPQHDDIALLFIRI